MIRKDTLEPMPSTHVNEAERRSIPRLAEVHPVRPLVSAARLVHSTNRIRNFASVLLGLLICTLIGMAWLPWQQSASGSGRVVAYKPGERQQEIMSPQKGVVVSVPPTLVEGAFVNKGAPLLEIEPFAANLTDQLDSQVRSLENKLENARLKAEAYRENVVAFTQARDFAVQAAQDAVEAAVAKLEAKKRMLIKYESKLAQAESNYARQQSLNRNQIMSDKDFEYIRVERDAAIAELEAGKQEVAQAESELDSKKAELEQKRSEAQAKIDKAKADEQAALSDMETIRKETADLRIKQGELRLNIEAPLDGYIQRLPVFTGGQTVKEGDYLLTFVPHTDDYAVELWIRGNDMPLVEPGDHVRLQFEGWPAVQFSGWPEMAMGTFGGEVAMVDPTDDGTGKFRVIVRPAAGETWPEAARLRQGVRVNGWVMLRQVSLAYEIWRQLNGFPPMPPEQQKGMDKDATKKPKLPK